MPTRSPEELKAATRRVMDELYNKGNKAVVYEEFAPNFAYHTPVPPLTPDREGIIQEALLVRKAFPDLRCTVDEVLVEGDTLVLRWTMRGTQDGDYFGVSPSHKQVTYSGLTLTRIVEDKITEAWNFFNTLRLFQELGAIPQAAYAQQPSVPPPQPQA